MPRKKQAQPKHCQEEADSPPAIESDKEAKTLSPRPEEEREINRSSHSTQSSETEKDEERPSTVQKFSSINDKVMHDANDEVLSIETSEGKKENVSNISNTRGNQISAMNNQSGHKRKSAELSTQRLLPELVHSIKKELNDAECQSTSCDEDKRDETVDPESLPSQGRLFNHFYHHYTQYQNQHKTKVADTDDEDEDREFKYRPPSSQRPNNPHMEGDDVSNGFSSPGSKVPSPYRPRSNSSEHSNVTDFRSHRSSSSSFSTGSSTSRTAASPSYTSESHVNRLQSFVESLTTPVTNLRGKMTKEGRQFIQSPTLPTAKMPACRDNYRSHECCTSKASLLSCYRSSYFNSMAGNVCGHNGTSTEQPLDLSLKKYQHRNDQNSYEGEALDGNLSGSASLLTLQSKFGENSPMLSTSSSKFNRVDFYNGLGYGFFRQSMYDVPKQKSFPLGSSNGFDARSPCLSSCSSSKPLTNEISSLKQMVSSCETGQPSSQIKLSNCCDANKLPLKRPRSGTNERPSETLHDKKQLLQNALPSQSSQHGAEVKKSKTSLQDRRLEKLQKKKMQNFASVRTDGAVPIESSSLTSSETVQNVTDKKKVHTNQRCSCGITYSNLFQLTVHVEETGHTPESLELDTAEDLPKLVRGQDIWISQGQEQTEMILRCIQCRTSFRSLPELTVHMVKTKHYINIVKADGDFSDPNNRAWMPKTTHGNDHQKTSLSLPSSHTPTTMPTNSNNNNNSPGLLKSSSQPDKKAAEIGLKLKNKTSDNENSSDKPKSDVKNSLKFGITEMLDFPSYKKMLKKMTENCEEIKPVDGVALTLFHSRLDHERMGRQTKNDSKLHSNHGDRSYPEEGAYQKFDSRSGSRSSTSKSSVSKLSQDAMGCKLSSSLGEKYLAPKFSFTASKNVSSNDESEPGDSKASSAEKKSLELVSPLPYGVDGASSLKAMENFIESSFSKISQSLHTPSSLPFPSFASRCLITAPVLENVYNNAFLRDAKASVRNASSNSNCFKSDGKKRSLDQSSSANEDLLRKRKKLQSHGPMSTSQSHSQTGGSHVKNEKTPGDARPENRLAVGSESSTDDSEGIRYYHSIEKNQVHIKEEKNSDEGKADKCSLNIHNLSQERYLSTFSSSINTCGKSSTPSQNSFSNSLDSIKMLASKFFNTDSHVRTFQPASISLNRKKEFNSDSYSNDYVSRQGLMLNPSTINDSLSRYNHHVFDQPPPFEPPNLIRIKPEPRDDEAATGDEMRTESEEKTPGGLRTKTERHGEEQNPSLTNESKGSQNAAIDADEEGGGASYQVNASTGQHQGEDQSSTSPLHLSRCQPSNFPINESLSTSARSCQQVQ